MPKVYNKRTDTIPEGAIYVGRPTKWGNPFTINRTRSRREVVQLYRLWLLSNGQRVEDAKRELRGKDLVCWCSPLPCHADILMEIANG